MSCRGCTRGYGHSRVLFDVSLTVGEGEVICLLGRNGVGKTTTLRTVAGQLTPTRGRVTLRDEPIGGHRAHEIARRGVAYVPADRRCFAALTVDENLEVGEKAGGDDREVWTRDRVYEFFPDLARLRALKAAYLSGGQQQMLTIGRGLMGNPELILLDEPAEGLAPVILETIEERLRVLTAEGLTVLLAEMNVEFALRLSDRAYVLEKGQVRYAGPVSELRERRDVMDEYLAV